MPKLAVPVKIMNESLIDLEDQWSNNLKVVDQLDSVPSGEYNPSVVLCTLEGILSDYSECTRNNRWYTEELWDAIINSDDFKELVDTRTLFGESDHPMDIEDRFDVHYNYVSHCVRDVYIDRANRCVCGKIDVLDTPAGRIIFTFVKYGSILGVSSRGAGDLCERLPDGELRRIIIEEDGSSYTLDNQGREYDRNFENDVIVDPRTYQFYAWDIVHRPSNRKARVKQSLGESLKSNNRLSALVESAKSDRNSLKWIRSLIESTRIQDKTPIMKKINEYIDMLGSSDDTESQLSDAERQAYEDSMENLRNDIIELTNEIVRLNAQIKEQQPVSSNAAVDTSQLQALFDKIDTLQTQVSKSLESQESKESDKTDPQVLDMISEVGERVLDRIDEAYGYVIKPLISVNRKCEPFGDLIKANGEFVIGEINKAIASQAQMSVVDDAAVMKLRSELGDVNKENSDLRKENKKLNERIKSILESRLSESRRYLSIRCGQLGLNESSVLKKLGNLEEYSFDDIDDELSEIYSDKPVDLPQSKLQEHIRVTIPEGSGTKKMNESSDIDLVSLIRNNN